MSEEKPVKKRFEGLIHFKGALRQAVVCLQASLETRFICGVQSELIRNLDKNTSSMHYLLFAEENFPANTVDSEQQLAAHHVLTRIYQQQNEDLCQEINCTSLDSTKISAWIDPNDPLVTHYLFRLISMVCHNQAAFDLKTCQAWGSLLQAETSAPHESAETFIRTCSLGYGFSAERTQILLSFAQALAALVKNIENIYLLADGTSMSLLIEAHPIDNFLTQLPNSIPQLANSGAHTIAINFPSDPNACTQFIVTTPVRLANKSISPFTLKGLVFLHKISNLSHPQKLKLSS